MYISLDEHGYRPHIYTSAGSCFMATTQASSFKMESSAPSASPGRTRYSGALPDTTYTCESAKLKSHYCARDVAKESQCVGSMQHEQYDPSNTVSSNS